jgi:hypothetical protein
MAVASLVLSILGIAPLGLIFGIIALKKIKHSNGSLSGRGLALAGVIISSVGLFIYIIIIVGFVGGTVFLTILNQESVSNQVVAYYGDKAKIRTNDILQAQADLQLLNFLGADRILGGSSVNSSLLGQLLFGDSRMAAALSRQLTHFMMQGQLDVDESDIDAFFREAMSDSDSRLYWLLLAAEAKEAGCVVSDEQAKAILTEVIPKLTNQERSYGQAVGVIVRSQGVTEERIIRTFAELLGILNYLNKVAAGEVINAEYVQIDATSLVGEQAEPTEEQLVKQFEAYKEFFAGDATKNNPYGFGYRLPTKVEIEYIIIKLDDVMKMIDVPSEDEAINYYQRNREMFEYTVSSKPNDPNSEKIIMVRSYAEVVVQIMQTLIREKTSQRANMIMSEVKDFTERGFVNIEDVSQANSDEIKALSGSYADVAEEISVKYNVKLYVGKTEMLSREGLARDKFLGNLMREGQFGVRVPIGKIVFSISELGESELGRFDGPTPKMWENIGLMTDGDSEVAVVRIVGVRKATIAESLDASYDKTGASPEGATSADLYKVRDEVIQDCRLLKGMEVAKGRADELIQLVAKNGWDDAIEEYNKKYETAKVRITSILKWRQISQQQVEVTRKAVPSNPMAKKYAESRALIDNLHSMIPVGETEAVDIVKVVGIEISRSYYVVKNVSRTAASLEAAVISSFGIKHFKPTNVMKRMNFRWVSEMN